MPGFRFLAERPSGKLSPPGRKIRAAPGDRTGGTRVGVPGGAVLEVGS